MNDFVVGAYDVWRGLHILAVIAWMAGLLYLPRLFANHVAAVPGGELDLALQTMERRLLRIIMNGAQIAAFAFGGMLIWANVAGQGLAFLLLPWMVVKIVGIVFLTWYHHFLAKARKAFATGTNTRSAKFWKAMNELPFVAAIVMVLAVTTQFGG